MWKRKSATNSHNFQIIFSQVSLFWGLTQKAKDNYYNKDIYCADLSIENSYAAQTYCISQDVSATMCLLRNKKALTRICLLY